MQTGRTPRDLGLIAVLVFAAAPAFAAETAAEGEWLLPNGKSKVMISPCAASPERLCGKISWLQNPAEGKNKDTNNPDPSLRGRMIMGLPVINGFQSAGQGRWTGGQIYDPQNGKTYKSKMTLNADGTLKVEGCVLMVCRPQTWTR
jgi:uncharacterized protein (DUF2147 family)